MSSVRSLQFKCTEIVEDMNGQFVMCELPAQFMIDGDSYCDYHGLIAKMEKLRRNDGLRTLHPGVSMPYCHRRDLRIHKA